jgi:LPXTG-motif cell wall-anchored protein
MGSLLLIVGFAFVLAGFLSIAGISELGMEYARYTQIQNLSFLQSYEETWVYIGFGILLILLSLALFRRRKSV